MFGPEGFGSSQPEKKEHPEEDVLSRRAFLRQSGAKVAGLALGIAGLGVSEEAEARRKERGGKDIEYVGFRPNTHQKMLIETRIKNIAPDALSTEVSLVKHPKEGSSFRISILFADGKHVDSISKPFQQRRDENITPALNEALTELERKLNSERPAEKPTQRKRHDVEV